MNIETELCHSHKQTVEEMEKRLENNKLTLKKDKGKLTNLDLQKLKKDVAFAVRWLKGNKN